MTAAGAIGGRDGLSGKVTACTTTRVASLAANRSPGAPASMTADRRTCSDYVREAKKDVATTGRRVGCPCRPSAPCEFDSHLTAPVGRVNPVSD